MLDNNTITAEELEQTVERTFTPPPSVNPNAHRYGMMFLINLPLYNHVGNSALMDVNPRAPDTWEVIKNVMYFPRMVLMPLKTLTVPIPPERAAEPTGSGDYAAHARAFNPTLADGGNYITSITKTAESCAKYAETAYGAVGYKNFYSLVGVGTYKEAKQIFYSVLPLEDESVFPKTKRNVLGETFNAPFLDQVIEYLTAPEMQEKLAEAKFLYGDERIATLYQEILVGARNANSIARSRIGDSERDMAAVPAQKIGYDTRDPLFPDGSEPMDLVCLAMLNEAPKSERELKRQQQMHEQNSQPINEFTQALGTFARELKGERNTPSAMSDEELQAELERRKMIKVEEVKTDTKISCTFEKEGGCNGWVIKDSDPPRCNSHKGK